MSSRIKEPRFAPTEASFHIRSADTPRLRIGWAAVANAFLDMTGEKESAIRAANAAVICELRHRPINDRH